MKKGIPVIVLLVLFSFFSSCEKDDICVDGDTPLLVVGFFDVTDTSLQKNVPSLRIRPLGFETSPTTFNDRSSLDSVAIPLQIGNDSTAFVFINNSADEDGVETGNIDTLTFNYAVVEKFVSRACGFVANFNDLSADLNPDAENWIQDIIIEDTLIENATAIHVKVIH